MVSFYFFMSLLELKTFDEAVAEVKTKFWPTYKVIYFFLYLKINFFRIVTYYYNMGFHQQYYYLTMERRNALT